MEFSELAKNRYSCRKLSDRPVEKEKLEEILSIARLSPTAHNNQPYRIFVASGEEAVRKIKETTPCDFGASLFLLIAAEKRRAGSENSMERISPRWMPLSSQVM